MKKSRKTQYLIGWVMKGCDKKNIGKAQQEAKLNAVNGCDYGQDKE